MKVLEQAKVVEQHGIVLRIVQSENKKLPYAVQHSPLNKDGTYDKDNFSILGGTVGYSTSEFKTEEEANAFFNDIQKLNKDQMAEKYPSIWVN